MDCPHCKQELELPSRAVHNVTSYGDPCVTITECCGHAVRMERVVSFRIAPYMGSNSRDDWGQRIKTTDTNGVSILKEVV